MNGIYLGVTFFGCPKIGGSVMNKNGALIREVMQQKFSLIDERPLFPELKDDGKSRFINLEEHPAKRRCPEFLFEHGEYEQFDEWAFR